MLDITNRPTYQSALAEIELILAKGLDNLTEDEEARLDELSDAVELWESKNFPMP